MPKKEIKIKNLNTVNGGAYVVKMWCSTCNAVQEVTQSTKTVAIDGRKKEVIVYYCRICNCQIDNNYSL